MGLFDFLKKNKETEEVIEAVEEKAEAVAAVENFIVAHASAFWTHTAEHIWNFFVKWHNAYHKKHIYHRPFKNYNIIFLP